jgi:ectoine hydroxylase-related dioxygenase (phytanoyl-CoA dioxygenase family)
MSVDADLGEAEISAFRRDGAIKLTGLIDEGWIEKLCHGVDENFADPGPDACRYTKDGRPGAFYDDYCNWTRIESYRDFVRHSPAGEIAGRLLESRKIRIYHEHVLVKEPGTCEVTPWHHDLPYYGVEGDQLCSLWLPLDTVPRHACPEFIAGSHASGVRYVPRLFENQQSYGEAGDSYSEMPDIDANRDQYEILSWDMNPGDCIAFHMATVHGAPGTADLTTPRRGFSTRWLGDDAVFAVRPWPTSPPFRDLSLNPGDKMDHALFPVIWQSSK